ncbi:MULTISPECIES: DEAD/DEAH box helicase [Vagococcus]|uniref:ComF operon protein A, DNA transporter ATPase n=1 Tax=Vagococcus fluvialis bH819 TaxID=1255619 RepID=A0A1X6WQ16_9ENTE|nr:MULTISPECIES: DEAD/DEAH box helicase [Vagococcus]SLM86433.1 ComF operon protein A, DNA transporter ATPase [Vagococcus fluvialis bH819]HCM90641.1 DNA/RNA helicase [Vagococcus sp.]
MSLENFLMGRKLLLQEIPSEYQVDLEDDKVKKEMSLSVVDQVISCHRCGSKHSKKKYQIKNKYDTFYYCPECIGLGRIESRNFLYSIAEKKNKRRKIMFSWEGRLTKQQEVISKKLVKEYKKGNHHLVHAVTGAGKTEMLFSVINYVLKKGGRVAIASPRIDVCLELHPRFQAVFPEETIALLYGKSKNPYLYTSLVVTTTHQLLRFSKAFDLIVVDEVDAFPYAGNPILEYGTQSALKKEGRLVYLTATPSQQLFNMVEKKELKLSQLSKRYHGYQLPVPECCFDFFLVSNFRKGKIPSCLFEILEEQDRQCLIFFPNIERMIQCFTKLTSYFPDKKIAYVFAGEEKREETIKKMRNKNLDWLLTTTILERGVTFPNIDVIVCEADHRVFNQASLVQISGRVGRKKEYPTGHVFFLHNGRTRELNKAIKQIKEMNRKAGF